MLGLVWDKIEDEDAPAWLFDFGIGLSSDILKKMVFERQNSKASRLFLCLACRSNSRRTS